MWYNRMPPHIHLTHTQIRYTYAQIHHGVKMQYDTNINNKNSTITFVGISCGWSWFNSIFTIAKCYNENDDDDDDGVGFSFIFKSPAKHCIDIKSGWNDLSLRFLFSKCFRISDRHQIFDSIYIDFILSDTVNLCTMYNVVTNQNDGVALILVLVSAH